MVLRCAWGTCNADERYHDRLDGWRFILFPKPKSNFDKCLRWIRACGRPHDQLNVQRFNKHKAVCSKHFVGRNGPTANYPDPVQADGSVSTPARKPRKRRVSNIEGPHSKKRIPLSDNTEKENCSNAEQNENIEEESCNTSSFGTRTAHTWVSPMDVLALTAELHQLRSKVERQESTIHDLKEEKATATVFGVTEVLKNKNKSKTCSDITLV